MGKKGPRGPHLFCFGQRGISGLKFFGGKKGGLFPGGRGDYLKDQSFFPKIWAKKKKIAGGPKIIEGFNSRKSFKGEGKGDYFLKFFPKKGDRFFNMGGGDRGDPTKIKNTLLNPRPRFNHVRFFHFVGGGWQKNKKPN